MCRFSIIILFASLCSSCVNSFRITDTVVVPTKGEIWPKPQKQIKKSIYYVLQNENAFNVTKPFYKCDIVNKAIERLLYGNLMNKFKYIRDETDEIDSSIQNNMFDTKVFVTHETEFRIELTKECEEIPHLDMDERYELVVGDSIVLSSGSVWGILRGLETFNHLLYFSDDYSEIRINATEIEDFPAYKHRGLLIDTGRHYLPRDVISRLIDSMEMNKLNVLHWHIVDDHSYPYQSDAFPLLSINGAFHPSMVYSKDDIQQLVEQARLAGIRVIPEFDVPDHVRSLGKSYPSILTECYLNKTVVNLGPLNPTKKETYKFLKKLYQEVNNLFPDKYIHIGGDEVHFQCWYSNHEVTGYILKNLLKSSLQSYFIKKVLSILPSQVKPIVWQDVFDVPTKLPTKTIIQVWRNSWIHEMDKVLAANHLVLFSSLWYLSILSQTWEQYYMVDPRQMLYEEHMKPYNTQIKSQKLQDIVGGEACMWGEMVDETNIFTRVWPNTAAVAERLWSGLNYQMNSSSLSSLVTYHVRRRSVEHVCRMRQAGIPVAALGTGYCLHKSN